MRVAVLLFGLAGGYSLIEGIEKIRHPEPLHDITLALVVLAIAFVVGGVSLVVAIREAVKIARARGVKTIAHFLDDNRDATLLTILVEDSLALVGLPVAAAALLLSVWTHNPMWDGIGSVIIGTLLMAFALFLGGEVRSLLIGRGLSAADSTEVVRIVAADARVTRVLHTASMYVGPQAVLLGVDVDIENSLSGADVEAMTDELEQQLRSMLPHLRYIYIEARSGATPTP